MADKAICPICDAESSALYKAFQDGEDCIYCEASPGLRKVVGDAMEAHYDEVEASGASLVNLQRPAIVTYVISQFEEIKKLKWQNAKLENAMKSVKQAVNDPGLGL